LVKLRLRRIGRKQLPVYKIVAADAKSPRDGRFIEALGTYNPGAKPNVVDIKNDRVLYWLQTGAKPTVTVKNLLSNSGILLKLHLTRKKSSESKISDELEKWKSLQDEKTKKSDMKRSLKKKAKKAKSKEPEKPAVAGT
jgi:small subunit ribosomal protein S16